MMSTTSPAPLPRSGEEQPRRTVLRWGDRFLGPAFWAAAALALRAVLFCQGGKRISALLRVRDEEQFLYAAAKSIIAYVDEMVLVDNLSSDRSPQIMRQLSEEHADKVRCLHYDYALARRGREHWELASNPATRSSPHLSSNYNNWCLRQCRERFILRWDADMIPTAAFSQALQSWRSSGAAVLSLLGANVHPDRRHLVAGKVSDAGRLAEGLTVPVVPRWLTTMSYTSFEERLFPRFGARHTNAVWWTFTFASPFTHPRLRKRFVQQPAEPAYLHLRFCKHNPLVGYSQDFAQAVSSNLGLGPELRPEWQELIQRWNV